MKMRRPGVVDSIIVLWLVGWTGSDFVKAWNHHSPKIVGEGMCFALALFLMLLTSLELKPRGLNNGSVGPAPDDRSKAR